MAEAAVEAGADIINDISALGDDPLMAAYCARKNLPVVLMHMEGSPANMQDKPFYDDVVKTVGEYLLKAAEKAISAGISRENIIVDPGIGFGKRQGDNIALLKAIGELKKSGFPLLIGLSRKQFIGNITGQKPEGRLAGTIGANAYALLAGAHILRVHDVRGTVSMVKMIRPLEGMCYQ